jgi:hypothetical protein
VSDTPCYVCQKPVTDYEPEMCCNGECCNCRGLPIEPPLCSEECSQKVFGIPEGAEIPPHMRPPNITEAK